MLYMCLVKEFCKPRLRFNVYKVSYISYFIFRLEVVGYVKRQRYKRIDNVVPAGWIAGVWYVLNIYVIGFYYFSKAS